MIYKLLYVLYRKSPEYWFDWFKSKLGIKGNSVSSRKTNEQRHLLTSVFFENVMVLSFEHGINDRQIRELTLRAVSHATRYQWSVILICPNDGEGSPLKKEDALVLTFHTIEDCSKDDLFQRIADSGSVLSLLISDSTQWSAPLYKYLDERFLSVFYFKNRWKYGQSDLEKIDLAHLWVGDKADFEYLLANTVNPYKWIDEKRFINEILPNHFIRPLQEELTTKVVTMCSSPSKRIVFLSPNWITSGVNTFTELLCARLLERNYNASILFTTRPNETGLVEMPNVPYSFLHMKTRPNRHVWTDLKFFLESQRPTICIPNYDFMASSVSPILDDGVGVIGVLHSDDPFHYEHGYRLGHYWNRIVTVSKTIETKLLELNPNFNSKTQTIHYGINTFLTQYPSKGKTLTIVYSGRLVEEQKRISRFIPIIRMLDQTEIDFKFYFIGDGTEMSLLQEKLSDQISSGNVSFLGRQPNSIVQNYLSKAHIFVLASDYEGLSLSLLEAMGSFCVPIVPRNLSGVDEVLVDGKNAILVNPTNSCEFVAAIKLLNFDREKMRSLADQANLTLLKHNLTSEKMADKYIGLFDEVLEEIQRGDYKRKRPIMNRGALGGISPPPYASNVNW